MSELFVGYGEEVITPPLGIDLSGYGFYLDRRGETILDDLKVRVLSLKKEGVRLILIACDLIGFTVEFSDKIRREIAKGENIPFENILLASIHTHSGPATRLLKGFGESNEDYLMRISLAIKEAVKLAIADEKEAEFSYRIETIEPIGFNRRKRKFEPIDPRLKVAIFKRDGEKIYLMSYACHAVTLGRTKEISADYPGAFIREIEKTGNKGIFFQGFCGDIDPVTNLNRWGKGREEDLLFYGELLARRAFKAEKYATSQKKITLKGKEKRIRLPLRVPKKEEIEKEREAYLKRFENSPSGKRFIEEWIMEVNERYEEFKRKPYLENVPIQTMMIGELKILSLPGEVFCEYGNRLMEEYSSLFTFGYANGVIGYIPTKDAYQDENDYACYLAPKFYGNLFPFQDKIEEIFIKESKSLLSFID